MPRCKLAGELGGHYLGRFAGAEQVEHHECTEELIKMVRPKIFPHALTREGVDELMLRTGRVGTLRTFIGTTNVGRTLGATARRRGLARNGQANYKSVEGAGWEHLHHMFEEMNKEVKRLKHMWKPRGKDAYRC